MAHEATARLRGFRWLDGTSHVAASEPLCPTVEATRRSDHSRLTIAVFGWPYINDIRVCAYSDLRLDEKMVDGAGKSTCGDDAAPQN